MNVKRVTLLAFVYLSVAWAAPEDGAVEQYKAYVLAVRVGKLDDVMKLVEPVPEGTKPLLIARVKQAIAIEAMKKEMLSQMGPPKADEDGWDIGGLPYDDVLKNLKAVAQDANMVGLVALDPRRKAEGVVGWMIRRDGTWIVPAGLVLDLEPASEFVEPEPEEQEEKIKYADATTKAADAVLQRLKKKDFREPAEVKRALVQEIQTAAKR